MHSSGTRVSPTITAPAARSLATTSWSALARVSENAREPHRVDSPAMGRINRTPVIRWLLTVVAIGGAVAAAVVATDPFSETAPDTAAPAGNTSPSHTAAPAGGSCDKVISALSPRERLAQLLVV